MSHHHDHHDDHDGGPDTDFLDLEMSKVLYDEARRVTREAYRELLKEAAKRQLGELWGERIEALAKLAVDELLADTEANLEIEAKIAARNEAKDGIEREVESILDGGGDSETETET